MTDVIALGQRGGRGPPRLAAQREPSARSWRASLLYFQAGILVFAWYCVHIELNSSRKDWTKTGAFRVMTTFSRLVITAARVQLKSAHRRPSASVTSTVSDYYTR